MKRGLSSRDNMRISARGKLISCRNSCQSWDTMKHIFLGAALVSALANVSAAAVDSAAQSVTTITRLGKATTAFTCGRGTSGACNYLILNSLCQEALLADGTKERKCRYVHAVPPFQLKAGESRTVANLPADYLYTMKGDRMPTIEECVAAPMAH